MSQDQAAMPSSNVNPLRVLVKALLMFLIMNAAFAYARPSIGDFSVWGHLMPRLIWFPPYVRYPNPQAAHGIAVQNVYDLEMLFSSHVISGAPKSRKEYRVVAIGDSTTRQSRIWKSINGQRLKTCNNKTIRIFDLGYHQPQAVKDLLILREATKYQPDLILWSFAENALLGPPGDFADANPVQLAELGASYGLPAGRPAPSWTDQLVAQSFIGRRRQLYVQALADLDFGIVGPALGKQDGPVLNQAVRDTRALAPSSAPRLEAASPSRAEYLFNALDVGHSIAGSTPLMLISEPVNLASDIFNRGQYTEFDGWMQELSATRHWTYLSYWDLLSPTEFSDSIHRNKTGDAHMEKVLVPALLDAACGKTLP